MADRYSFGHKALSVVLSVVLLGFGWPAVNPSETFASDESAQADQVQAEVAQPEETQALEEDSAVDNQGFSQAAAAQAKTEYDISLVLKNASIKKADGTNELVSLPATKVTVSADKDFKFTVVPDSACKLNRVLVNVAGQEYPPPYP